ncbi:MAG: prepilin-type N-terminal cleavage/methylation domain-containing protein [bacterium]|nr:prepilin-type N-terminal cleavage/methylation domain-containing protein [bacterium]
MQRSAESGFSLLEFMVSLSVFLLCSAGLAQVMVESSRINKSEQMTAQVQANARNCLSMVVQRLRSAGWDPMNAGIVTVALDADLGDAISEIEVFSDLDADGTTAALDEQVLIRHTGTRVEWRRDNDVATAFDIVASHISNDANGDGTAEPMFVPDSTTAPTRITVRITAESPGPDPMSGEPIRHTVTSDVALRKSL